MKVPSATTLWDLKARIANSFGHVLDDGLRLDDPQECNCAFAKYIQKQGVWRKLDCMGHTDSGGEPSSCQFLSVNGLDISSSQCAICKALVQTHDEQCKYKPAGDFCTSSIFLRMDTRCNHIIHSGCAAHAAKWTCPPSCHSGLQPSKQSYYQG